MLPCGNRQDHQGRLNVKFYKLILFLLTVSPYTFAMSSHCPQLLKKLQSNTSTNSVHINLSYLLHAPDFQGSDLIDFLSQDPQLANFFAADAGVFEGYSIREHTEMVYEKFHEQLPHHEIHKINVPSHINIIKLFKFIISIHDIGKPLAIANEGKHAQHKYTVPIVSSIMDQLEFHDDMIKLALNLIDNDVFGDLLKGNISVNHAHQKLSELAKASNLSTQDYFQLQSFFFTIDASSYPFLHERLFDELNGKLIIKSTNYYQLADRIYSSNL